MKFKAKVHHFYHGLFLFCSKIQANRDLCLNKQSDECTKASKNRNSNKSPEREKMPQICRCSALYTSDWSNERARIWLHSPESGFYCLWRFLAPDINFTSHFFDACFSLQKNTWFVCSSCVCVSLWMNANRSALTLWFFFSLLNDLDVVHVIAVAVLSLWAMFKNICSIGWASVRFGRLKAYCIPRTKHTCLHLHNQTIRTFYLKNSTFSSDKTKYTKHTHRKQTV